MPEAQRREGRLEDVLAGWAADDPVRRAVMTTTHALAEAAVSLGRLLEGGQWLGASPGAGDMSRPAGASGADTVRKGLNAEAHALFLAALERAPVAAVLSEESDAVIDLQRGAPLVVALDPLDGSSNVSVNGPLGAIYSVRPNVCGGIAEDFLRPGSEQLAAGFVLFGPSTVLVTSVGAGTDVYVLARNEGAGAFVRATRGLQVPLGTPAYSVNAANARHWSPELRSYIADLQAGAEGLRGKDFDMRWYGALVSEAFRILEEGGIYLYPADDRPEYRGGRLRLVYEAHPVAFLVEQAGGRATDGEERVLDKVAAHPHARTPLVFGSPDKVDRLGRYLKRLHADAERDPLFATRSLLRG